jgi:inositol-phosphate phosphatase / L-galactose 1-phosphate phosphatase / histidinol-phosphatase
MPRRSASERDLERFAFLARELSEITGDIALRWFRNEYTTETKSDATPVTIADRECERIMRERIRETFPEHGIVGEEQGSDRPDATWVWVLDPIDGTKAFISGRPIWGSLIALCRDGVPVVGVVHCPAVEDCWVGIEGHQTTHNDMPCRSRSCDRLEDALLYSTSPYMFAGDDAASYERLRTRVKYPLFGGDCHNYGLVASGWIDLVVEANLKVHDWAALVPIAAGAGAKLTDWDGGALSFESDGRVVMAGDARMHEAAVALLHGS